jgi:replication fork protection complex subunit Csm3/Swi3
MVEKMGHKRMLQVARMEWINEGRPKPDEDDDILPPVSNNTAQGDEPVERSTSRIAPIFEKRASERPKTPAGDDLDAIMDDLYDATPQRPRSARQAGPLGAQASLFGAENSASLFGPKKTTTETNELDEDDLDALLAEEDALQAAGGASKQSVAPSKDPAPDSFDDEMEAMAEMDGMW